MIQPHAVSAIPDDFIDEIRFEIDLCPVDAIELHLRRSVISFCEKTHYWQQSATAIVVVADTISYPILTPAGTESVGIVCVADEVNEIELVRTSDPSVTYRYWQSSPGYIDLYPNDELAGLTISVDVALRPVAVADAFDVSVSLLSDYRTAIIAGTKAALYKIPNKPWTDLQQAGIENSTFEAIVNDARLYVGRAYSRMPDASISKQRTFY